MSSATEQVQNKKKDNAERDLPIYATEKAQPKPQINPIVKDDLDTSVSTASGTSDAGCCWCPFDSGSKTRGILKLECGSTRFDSARKQKTEPSVTGVYKVEQDRSEPIPERTRQIATIPETGAFEGGTSTSYYDQQAVKSDTENGISYSTNENYDEISVEEEGVEQEISEFSDYLTEVGTAMAMEAVLPVQVIHRGLDLPGADGLSSYIKHVEFSNGIRNVESSSVMTSSVISGHTQNVESVSTNKDAASLLINKDEESVSTNSDNESISINKDADSLSTKKDAESVNTTKDAESAN
eukprot:3770141-Ditylum_brightwellii.AAC.1